MEKGTWKVKTGLAQTLKGGVIMDVVTPEQAKIAEEAGACAVMALERVAADFLYRLLYLINQPIENLQTDNGSEFALEFEKATAKLSIQRYFSRVKTPKDNSEIERFDEILE